VRPDDAATPPPLERQLPFRAPIATDRLLGFLSSRAIPGVEHVEGDRYVRSMRTSEGLPVVVELSLEGGASAVTMRVHGADHQSRAQLEARVRELLDLDADPAAIDGALVADPVLAPLVRAAPGLRVPGAVDGFEVGMRAIVGQQVSVAGARTTLGRLSSTYGEALDVAHGPVTHVFPRPERLADAPRDALGMPGSRADAIRAVAVAVATRELDLTGAADLDATVEALRSIKGIGEWTATYIAMRALRDRDAFLGGDLGVRRRFAALGLPDDLASMRRHAERWRPWRAYAVMHLWLADRQRVAPSP
jgi:AraC family transcriptional regulator, regulatory protein of adaptative response / DNA-3-methyladenine glycosylase II